MPLDSDLVCLSRDYDTSKPALGSGKPGYGICGFAPSAQPGLGESTSDVGHGSPLRADAIPQWHEPATDAADADAADADAADADAADADAADADAADAVHAKGTAKWPLSSICCTDTDSICCTEKANGAAKWRCAS